ncbi:unnamed protein product [Colias eurytheme]|nr:unnamed protein product [Colias eurytheme]
MTPRAVCLLFICIFAFGCVNGRLLNDPYDDAGLETNELEVSNKNENRVMRYPEIFVFNIFPSFRCAQVGEFCNNNEDCCSNLCLGFMKRCVSGYE